MAAHLGQQRRPKHTIASFIDASPAAVEVKLAASRLLGISRATLYEKLALAQREVAGREAESHSDTPEKILRS